MPISHFVLVLSAYCIWCEFDQEYKSINAWTQTLLHYYVMIMQTDEKQLYTRINYQSF